MTALVTLALVAVAGIIWNVHPLECAGWWKDRLDDSNHQQGQTIGNNNHIGNSNIITGPVVNHITCVYPTTVIKEAAPRAAAPAAAPALIPLQPLTPIQPLLVPVQPLPQAGFYEPQFRRGGIVELNFDLFGNDNWNRCQRGFNPHNNYWPNFHQRPHKVCRNGW